MGALDYLSNFCTVTSTRGKRKAMQVLSTHSLAWLQAPGFSSKGSKFVFLDTNTTQRDGKIFLFLTQLI